MRDWILGRVEKEFRGRRVGVPNFPQAATQNKACAAIRAPSSDPWGKWNGGELFIAVARICLMTLKNKTRNDYDYDLI